MGGCQNYGPFLGTLNIRGRIIIGIQKGTIILTTTHIGFILGSIGIYDSGIGLNGLGFETCRFWSQTVIRAREVLAKASASLCKDHWVTCECSSSVAHIF